MTTVEAGRIVKCPKCGANLSAKLVCELRDAESYQTPIEHAKVYQKFPSDLANLLDVCNVGADFVYLKPKAWLGSETFGKILTIVKELKGEWVSAGKDSAFKIPREAFA